MLVGCLVVQMVYHFGRCVQCLMPQTILSNVIFLNLPKTIDTLQLGAGVQKFVTNRQFGFSVDNLITTTKNVSKILQ